MKMTVSAPTIVRWGKNLGKKNATNVLTQALRDCQSKYESKLKAGYTVGEEVEAAAMLPFPMAVKTWRDHGHKLQYPLLAQPKLDGVRMLAQLDNEGKVRLATRRLRDIAGFESVKAALQAMFRASGLTTFVIDGELYSHGTNLQTISGIVRNTSAPESEKEKLRFHVFDCFDVSQPDMPFEERYEHLGAFVRSINRSKFIQLTETRRVATPKEADMFFEETVAKGYEGVIYKSTDRKYEFDFNKERRSAWYLKRKKQEDAEYAIVGYTQGKGKDIGCAVFMLETAEGKCFNSVPNGTYEYRKKLYELAVEDFGRFKGKLAKVQFDDLSKDGVPLRGRIVQIGRDYSLD